ncbi:unnamed protein product [Dibothriocephalus latus]|uniref:Uncharacterized protein n=1 Tax=Dibothriocephalus latus TaxID=60516 RepID=A0A3P7LU01_DIBLA|nr:unnamed protein product [Dibothriocephalus latus]
MESLWMMRRGGGPFSRRDTHIGVLSTSLCIAIMRRVQNVRGAETKPKRIGKKESSAQVHRPTIQTSQCPLAAQSSELAGAAPGCLWRTK